MDVLGGGAWPIDDVGLLLQKVRFVLGDQFRSVSSKRVVGIQGRWRDPKPAPVPRQRRSLAHISAVSVVEKAKHRTATVGGVASVQSETLDRLRSTAGQREPVTRLSQSPFSVGSGPSSILFRVWTQNSCCQTIETRPAH